MEIINYAEILCQLMLSEVTALFRDEFTKTMKFRDDCYWCENLVLKNHHKTKHVAIEIFIFISLIFSSL